MTSVPLPLSELARASDTSFRPMRSPMPRPGMPSCARLATTSSKTSRPFPLFDLFIEVIIDGGTDRRPVQVGVRCLGPRAAMRTYAGGRGDARELGRSASHCDEVLKGSEVDRLGNVSE